MKKKIAVIGSGIAGLTSAYFLQNDFEVTIFEKNDYLGGHANTQTVKDSQNQSINIDTGFIVYNEFTYPNLTKLFDILDVPVTNSDMSFSFYNSQSLFEYGGGSIKALFANPQNLWNWKFYKMLKDIVYFYKYFQNNNVTSSISIRQYLESKKFSSEFINNHFLPLISSIWSTPDNDSLDQPLSSIVSFFQNHKLFNFTNRPKWKTVSGGSHNYIRRLTKNSNFQIKKSIKIQKISRSRGIFLQTSDGEFYYDYLILACAPHLFLSVMDQKSDQEINILDAFRFQKNLAQLHNNSSLMPPHKAAWSSWNFHTNNDNQCTLSYWMNKLQPRDTSDQFFVSLNQNQNTNLYQTVYEHPIFSLNTLQSQKNIGQIQGAQNTYYVGSYLGYGFHEDGIQSSLKVCEKLNVDVKNFINADTSRIPWN